MTTFNVTSGKLKGTQIQARDEAHARKLLKARLTRLKQKESKLTDLEKQLIFVCLDVMTGDWSPHNLDDENGNPVLDEKAWQLRNSIINKLEL